MKKALLFVVATVFLVILGLGIFIATFDADRYRPQLVSQLERSLGRPVKLDRVSLGWRNGIALQLSGLTIAEGERASREPLLQMESAGALVRLGPLLHKEVQVSSVVLRKPRIHLVRDAQGNVNLTGLAAAASPSAAHSDVSGGRVGASSQTASAGEGHILFQVASLRIEEGALHWTDAMTHPPTDLWVKRLNVTVDHIAPGEPMDVEASGALAGETPNIHLSGRLTVPREPQPGSLERMRLTIENLPLETIMPPASPGEPQLHGKLSMTLEGSAPTLELATLTRAISANGRVQWAEPVVTNLNVLRLVFEKFSMIPGLVQTLEARLPETYQAKLAARDTVLEPINLSATLEGGLLKFHDVSVRTDTFGISGSGTISLDGMVDVPSVLRIEPAFSAALIRSVKELQALTNAREEMEIPVLFQGHAPRIVPVPDLRYVASKVIVTKAADLIGEFLNKHAPSDGEQTGADQNGSPSGGILGQFLQRALGSDSSPDGSPPSSQP